MAEKFGKTWWGNAWLQSLTHIDNANRIPRGASYARKGSVSEIQISENKVLAKVIGSMPRPYKIVIEIPKFTQDEKDKLIDALCERPAIISNLLDRKLDAEVLDVAEQCGVQIFPTKWSDFKMKCSCPDYAVPCKHLAAVIYVLSREIDNNPFIVFEMHGLNILEALSARGVKADGAKSVTAIPAITELYKTVKTEEQTGERIRRRIDFSKIEDYTCILLSLLPDEPSFSTYGNFKTTYAAQLQKIQKNVLRLLDGKKTPENLFEQKTASRTITLDTDIRVSIEDKTFADYMLSLFAINPDFLPDYSPSVFANHQALFATLHLLANGCVAPKIAKNSIGEYVVVWMAAEIVPQVKTVMARLSEIIPADMECTAQTLVSLYLTHIVNSLSALAGDPITDLFFFGRTRKFSALGTKEHPGAIKSWTDHLWEAQDQFQPVFCIEENEETELFSLHLSVLDRKQQFSTPTRLSEVLSSKKFEKVRFIMLRPFSMLSVLMPETNKYINKGAKEPICYTYNTFTPFLLNVLPTVRMLDIKVFMPKSIVTLLRPKPTIKVSNKRGDKSVFGLSDLLSFSWQVAIGNNVVSYAEFEKMLHKNSSLLKFKGEFVYISPEDIKRLHNAMLKNEEVTDGQLLQAVLSGEYESAPVVLSDEIKEMIKEMTKQETVPLPKSLQATLRPYQERGYSWLYRNMRIGFGSILADDMGLGKTLQTITLLLKLKEDGALVDKKVLIVVPTGLLTNWQHEIERFAPSLSYAVYHGNKRALNGMEEDILLTTYGVVRTDIAKMKKMPWRVMVIDEAQNIKNHTAQQSKAVFAIPADTHIALSGTPVENRLSEFWSIMNFANHGYFDTIKDFNQRYAKPIQLRGDAVCAERFRRISAPFMMRRMKTDKSIISDLPDKIEQNDYITLMPDQAALYQSTLNEAMQVIEGLDINDSKQLFRREGLILQMILALKQICNHPSQYLKNNVWDANMSGKTITLLDTIAPIVDAGEKVLVFTQFKEMGDMLARFVEEKIAYAPLFYHGGCSVKQRREMVERFQNNREDKVFILSLKAAGTGLNLTAASHVIHYDLWWNPAVEAQATDRAYRIGQNKNVIVHRFITKDTFEEKIDTLIQSKKHLADMTVATGENWIGKLSNSELREIFG